MLLEKIAIVTGATGGIGSEICKRLTKDRFKVIATYRPENAQKAKLWQEQLTKDGINLVMFPVDVSDFNSCAKAIESIRADFGHVSVLINNAGITDDASMKNITCEQWQKVLCTNLDSVFNTSKLVFQGMCDKGWGRIVNISSINGQKGQFGQVNYAAAKAGMYGFTKSLAQEGARKGVTVNTVSPGYISTDMVTSLPKNIVESIINEIPVNRLGTPAEIANAVSFLVGEHSGFITGSNIAINGGQHMY